MAKEQVTGSDLGRTVLKTEPLISVVMSVFNGEKFLAEAIESILNQSFRDFEFIIVDDGSTDGSGRIVDSYAEMDRRVRVYHQPNRGLADASNHGCRLARGKYIARMDADDVAFSDRLLWQVDFMEQHPEVGAVGGSVDFIDVQGRRFRTFRYPLTNEEIRCSLYRVEGNLCHPAALIRKSAFLATAGYRRLFRDAADYDLWLQIAERSKLANLDRVVLGYRIHPDQASTRKVKELCLSVLGARRIALSVTRAAAEALSWPGPMTPELLAQLGVTREVQQRHLAKWYHYWICILAQEGDVSTALSLATEMLDSSRWEYVDRTLLAEMWLLAVSLYRRQGMIFRSLKAAARAVMISPIVAVRLPRPFLRQLVMGLYLRTCGRPFKHALDPGYETSRNSTWPRS